MRDETLPHETPPDGVATLRRLLADRRVALLTTVDEDGRLHARPMITQQAEFAGDLWFLTGRATHKADEIRARPQVNVAYADGRGDLFLSLSGVAELIDDPGRMAELWRDDYATWFPLGLDDPDLGLLRVRVERAEYWETPHGVARLLTDFLVSVTNGGHPDLARHGRIDLGR